MRHVNPRPPKLLALALASLGVLASCKSRADDPRPNIVLIVVDTLRQSHVGCYGASRDTTPTLDALAAEGVRFESAYASAPWTCPSVASILTGRSPSSHGLMAPRTGLAAEVETIAEMLAAEGYATAGVVSNSHLKSVFSFNQGFDLWFQDQARDHAHVSTPGVTDEALRAVEALVSTEKPFFLFALYFDPHYDYTPHPEYGFAVPEDGVRVAATANMIELRRIVPELTPSELTYIRGVYDEEVRFTDAGIGRLLDALRRSGVYDNTVVVVTADHGEEFVDRDWLGHCRTLYDELVKVPLIVRVPDATAARTVEMPISLVSIVPTLREFAGLAPNARHVDAPSLLPFLRGGELDSYPPIFTEVDFKPFADPNQEAHKRALIDGGYKVIRDLTTGKVELYDLARDPGERDNLAESEPEFTRERLELLDRVHAAAAEASAVGTDVELSQEDIDVLGAMGYAGDSEPPADAGADR